MRYTSPSRNSFPLWTHLGETEENRGDRESAAMFEATTRRVLIHLVKIILVVQNGKAIMAVD